MTEKLRAPECPGRPPTLEGQLLLRLTQPEQRQQSNKRWEYQILRVLEQFTFLINLRQFTPWFVFFPKPELGMEGGGH